MSLTPTCTCWRTNNSTAACAVHGAAYRGDSRTAPVVFAEDQPFVGRVVALDTKPPDRFPAEYVERVLSECAEAERERLRADGAATERARILAIIDRWLEWRIRPNAMSALRELRAEIERGAEPSSTKSEEK